MGYEQTYGLGMLTSKRRSLLPETDFQREAKNMKKEEVKNLVREYLVLRKKIDHLQEELRGIRNRFGKTVDLAVLLNKESPILEELMGLRKRIEGVEGLLYAYRSKDFIRSVVSCVVDLEVEYKKDKYYHNFLASLIGILRQFEEFDADRRKYGNLILLPEEKVE